MSLPIKGVNTCYMPFTKMDSHTEVWKDYALGALCFGQPNAGPTLAEASAIPTIHLSAPILLGDDVSMEVWLSTLALSLSHPLSHGFSGDIQYSFNKELLFGVISLPESDSLEETTESAYHQIFSLMEAMDYPYIYRLWNYMADINGISHNLERYRQFNVGRKAAFSAFKANISNQLPAACALGLDDGPLSIAFLLGHEAPIAIENPRQINAFEYPEEYGPRTPSFSRATLLHSEQNEILFISGTASIVGHQTVHPLDVVAQTTETLVNLEAVIAEANRIIGEQKFDICNIHFRVYIRNALDLPLVRNEMERYINAPIKAVFVQADICRKDLLLEIEATVGSTLELSFNELS